jgi:hypothetical protein
LDDAQNPLVDHIHGFWFVQITPTSVSNSLTSDNHLRRQVLRGMMRKLAPNTKLLTLPPEADPSLASTGNSTAR